jgi:hypothetical protein
MDPYLENPALWPDVHHELMSVIRRELNAQLRPRYVVRIEERIYVSDEDDPGRRVIVPDLRIKEREGAASPRHENGGVATVEPIVVTMLLDDEIHEARLEVIDAETRTVVTVLEILSPSNKVLQSRGRESYQHKRHELLTSSTHFVEIDLLRAGRRMQVKGGLPPCDYVVHVSRVEQRPDSTVWPLRLQQRLPQVPIPLTHGDADGVIDLQRVLATAYDTAGYDGDVDYRRDPPPPPLTDDQRAWLNEVLTKAGLR